MKKLLLVIEKSKDGKLWGRIEFDDDLIVDTAVSSDELEKKMKRLLRRFHQVEPSEIKFELAYDLCALFTQKDYLNVSAIALPGNIKTAISGIGVYYPDKKETQGSGIIPDVEIRPTIAGIREGKDELVDKAIELINK